MKTFLPLLAATTVCFAIVAADLFLGPSPATPIIVAAIYIVGVLAMPPALPATAVRFFRSRRAGLSLVLALTVAAIAFCLPAFAADGGAASTALSALAPTITEILAAVALAIITYVVTAVGQAIKRKTGIDAEASLRAIEASHRDALNSAIKTAVNIAITWGGGKLDPLAERSAIVKAAVPLIGSFAADALAHFQLDPATLETKVEAFLTEKFGLTAAAKADAAGTAAVAAAVAAS